MQLAGRSMGVELQSVETPYPEVESFLAACGPAIVRLGHGEPGVFLAIIRSHRKTVRVLGPDLKVHRANLNDIRVALCRPLEEPVLPQLNPLLDQANLTRKRRNLVMASILRERLSLIQIQDCWLLRSPSSARLLSQLRERRVLPNLAVFLTAYSFEYLLTLASWWVIGRGALQGRLDYGWLLAWALLLLTRVPVRMLVAWKQGLLAVGVGALIKSRLLAGTLHLQPEEVRHQGVGQLLGRVIESEAFESLALSGGLTGLAAFVEIIIVALVLAIGAGSLLLALALAFWMVILFLFARSYFHNREYWTRKRIEITNQLVERMAGHKTRLAQEPRHQWHKGEDDALEHYLESSAKLDRSTLPLIAIVPRGWILLSLLCLAPRMISGAIAPTALALAIGGILLGQSALQRMTESLAYLTGAVIAWRQVKELFAAAAREEVTGSPEYISLQRNAERLSDRGRPIIETHDLIFQHPGRAEKILHNCSLRIFPGDQILLEGASGSGKSTLASLLGGLREPHSGLLMLRGLDRQTLGAQAWRRTVAFTPQANENHVFSATLAFNLLMGRRWPPRPEDYEEAENVCRELGLGDLLDRMPAGLQQAIGETGWQLSYGERSRLFLARALLQRADLLILDESLGALDPETLPQVTDCIRHRAPALMVIAHP
jgi:ATP-binding cassette subfamily B protein